MSEAGRELEEETKRRDEVERWKGDRVELKWMKAGREDAREKWIQWW